MKDIETRKLLSVLRRHASAAVVLLQFSHSGEPEAKPEANSLLDDDASAVALQEVELILALLRDALGQ